MKKYITFVLLWAACQAFGQVAIKKSSISTGGGSATAGNTAITFAIGETAINEAQQGNTAVSEGFIGPDILHIVGIRDFDEMQGVEVYPNPTGDLFWVQLPDFQAYEFYLFTIDGRQVLFKTARNERVPFNIAPLRAATYLLLIVDKTHKTQKIVKIEKQ